MIDDNAISVSQLSNYIKSIFMAEEMLHNILVYGEITSLSVSSTAVYFSIKDEGAILSCVCFDGKLISGYSNGDKVVLRGTPNYYVKGGKLNFNVSSIKKYGVGDLYQKFVEMKDKLQKEGLFDDSHKKSLPKDIKNIGVVTSDTGAVIHDIINVSTRRCPQINIYLSPCKVQGNDAETDIIRALKLFEKFPVDAIVIARGGGSLEDLMAYNTESLARAIYECDTFVMSAVGHETDYTICDFVSDLRAPTPSAAAELLTDDKNVKYETISSLTSRLFLASKFLEINTQKYLSVAKEIDYNANILLSENDYAFKLLENSLEKLNPKRLLNQGYAKIEKNGCPISSVNSLSIGENLYIYLNDGKVTANVGEIRRDV